MSRAEKTDGAMGRLADVVDRYRVTDGDSFDIDRHASNDLPDWIAADFPDKKAAAATLQAGVDRLAALQELLYAARRWSLLVVFQAMDAGGKDSTVKHVLSGINPQGVVVTSFKAPSALELAHDFLWRVHAVAPARGMIGVFNRSHYEDVLAPRVHPELLDASGLPASLRERKHFWKQRIADIAAFESYLARQGTVILKFFLDVGRDEQKARFLARLDEPGKTWKFEPADVRARDDWDAYRKAYTQAIAGTATPQAPWFVVPADRKWYTRLVVAETIIAALEALDLRPPTISDEKAKDIARARKALEKD